MAIINSYPTVTPKGSDLVLMVDKSTEGNPTKTATIASINATATAPDVATAKVSITNAQIRTMGTVPVEILPGITNKIYQIISLTVQSKGNAGLSDSYDWGASGDGVFYGQGFTSTQHRVEIPNSILPRGGASLAADAYVAMPISGGWRQGSGIRLSTTIGVDPTTINSPSAEMVVNITYRLIELV